MFILASEIYNVIYSTTTATITEGDLAIVQQAIDAAVQEMKSYLSPRYNTATIFSATGSARNAMVLEQCKTIAVWNLIRLSNADVLYDQWKERYDRVIDFLKLVAAGSVTPDLPLITDGDGEVVVPLKIIGNPKFHHYF